MEIINQVLLPAVNNSLTTAALLAAQVLAGMSQESNIIGALAGMFGRRDIWSDINNGFLSLFNQVLLPAVNNSLTTAALLGAQVLAGMSQESNIISSLSGMLGKRDFWSDLGDSLLTTVTDTANTLLSGLALQLAISLAGFGLGGGISPIGRELKDFWTDLGDSLLTTVTDTANTLLSGLALQLAISLATFGLGGGISPIGK